MYQILIYFSLTSIPLQNKVTDADDKTLVPVALHDKIQTFALCFLGWFCKMLRNTRHSIQLHICGENSLQKAYGKVKSKGEDGSGDLHPSVTASPACGRFPQLLRRPYEHLHRFGAL